MRSAVLFLFVCVEKILICQHNDFLVNMCLLKSRYIKLLYQDLRYVLLSLHKFVFQINFKQTHIIGFVNSVYKYCLIILIRLLLKLQPSFSVDLLLQGTVTDTTFYYLFILKIIPKLIYSLQRDIGWTVVVILNGQLSLTNEVLNKHTHGAFQCVCLNIYNRPYTHIYIRSENTYYVNIILVSNLTRMYKE